MPLTPLNRHAFHNNRIIAERFLDSVGSRVLHELGHAVVANVAGRIDGHLIISSNLDARCAFVICAEHRDRINNDSERCSFVAAGGMLAERHYINCIIFDRIFPDINQYMQSQGYDDSTISRYTARPEGITEQWNALYSRKFAALTKTIDINYRICSELSDSIAPIEKFTIIPTSLLRLHKSPPSSSIDLESDGAKLDAIHYFKDPLTVLTDRPDEPIVIETNGALSIISKTISYIKNKLFVSSSDS
jgi:hypothetical protein